MRFEAADRSPWGGGMNGLGGWVPSLGGATQFFRIGEARRVTELIRNQAHR